MSVVTRPVQEDDRCPQEGCHWVVVFCDCDESLPGGHVICLGCGQDADQSTPDPSSPCDCLPADQPPEDEPNYRP